ncbi:MAG: glycosyltransferase family 4 protein [Salinisphaera sp.]|jgi:UDP-glucose:(heptosyl)LPS alpha-1,3-glucosyltransferase|nr:glycosyltransferase family 4 protein [Salinisphaera sp.]
MKRQQALVNGRRIAIVFRGIGDIGGTNNTIADHARQFEALGYQVDLIGEKISRSGLPGGTGRGIRISRLPLAGRYKWRWFAGRAQRVVDRAGYDFVAGHGHHYRQNVLSMHNCLHRAHELVHGEPIPADRGLVQVHDRIFSIGQFAYCICNSRLMQDEIVSRYGVERERLPVVYPGYRPSQFNRSDRDRYRGSVRAELGCDDSVLIGLVTSGDFAKRGLDILLEAYAGIPDKTRRKTRLLVLGKLGKSARFIERAKALGIADRLHFVPHTREPQRYFHALDICVHPARYEEFGQTVQEAMACGVPVVTNQRVGASELLPAAWHEQLPSAPDAGVIRARLCELINSSERRAEQAAIGYDAVRSNTDTRNMERTLLIYRDAGLPTVQA